MAIKFEKIYVGMVLWDVRRNRGYGSHKWNTWPVCVKEVDSDNRKVLASWNGNAQVWMAEKRITNYRAKRPS
jgi:hypothetical protein